MRLPSLELLAQVSAATRAASARKTWRMGFAPLHDVPGRRQTGRAG